MAVTSCLKDLFDSKYLTAELFPPSSAVGLTGHGFRRSHVERVTDVLFINYSYIRFFFHKLACIEQCIIVLIVMHAILL